VSMFADYTGEVHSRSRNRALSPQTIEIRAALRETVTTGKFKVIPGTTEKEFKAWETKLRVQAGQLDLGVKVRLSEQGTVAFKAHELEVVEVTPPPPVVPTKREPTRPPTPPVVPTKRGPGRPRKNEGR